MNLAPSSFAGLIIGGRPSKTYIFPWVLDGLDIGPSVLEIGPGPGVTTDLLRTRVDRVPCVEIDRRSAIPCSAWCATMSPSPEC